MFGASAANAGVMSMEMLASRGMESIQAIYVQKMPNINATCEKRRYQGSSSGFLIRCYFMPSIDEEHIWFVGTTDGEAVGIMPLTSGAIKVSPKNNQPVPPHNDANYVKMWNYKFNLHSNEH